MASSTFVAYHICVSIFLALIPKMAPIPKKTMEIAIGITPSTGNWDRNRSTGIEHGRKNIYGITSNYMEILNFTKH